MPGRQYPEWLGQAHFLLTFVSTNLTFYPRIFLGAAGMPRRIIDLFGDSVPLDDGLAF